MSPLKNITPQQCQPLNNITPQQCHPLTISPFNNNTPLTIVILVDECYTNTDTCSPHAACTDTIDAYECTCNNGYSGDGEICTGQY